MKIKSFECPKSIRNCEKNNVWNIRRLVVESFVPSTKLPNILYRRLSGFYLVMFLKLGPGLALPSFCVCHRSDFTIPFPPQADAISKFSSSPALKLFVQGLQHKFDESK